MKVRRAFVQPEQSLSMRRQCEILAVNRSSLYYETVHPDPEELALMRRIDALHLEFPFFGSRRIARELREVGLVVNRKRVQRLMRIMDIEAIAPKPNTLDSSFCVEALHEALSRFGQPEIFNTDQGVQFTAEAFTSVLLERGIKISMDGKGRCIDNVFIERLWRSLKYEDVYLNDYDNPVDARAGIGCYLGFYNDRRMHQALGYQTPSSFYDGLLPEAA